ncbi:MAG TPA: ATP-binding protein, partial [Saprospiraceae bacterium]|nr:ATP-binding protein [Saprospiraceae bacterium]
QLLKTAFLNLMDNACKFSADHQVQVRISLPGQRVEIRFSDRGIGVPPGEEEQIFNSFFRGSNVSGTTRGYGIGLSLSRRIMQLHQGSIRMQSRAEGGSEFIVILPVIH